MDSDLMNVAALGRPFTLGMLYNARKDVLIPGLTLWDDETLQGKINETSQNSSSFAISTSDTIESKSSLLDVEASLKASFLSGLIEIEGSAKYLNDQKKFKNQSRVTCQYKATTNFKQLSMIDLVTLGGHQTDIIKKSLATHVVTGILYGANAFFVFDSEKLEASSVQTFQAGMKAAINKIPMFDFEASVDTKLTNEEKAVTEKCSCKFYGDFILESNPVTYVEAVKTYAQLPKLLGDKGEHAVPLKVWLMPLKNLCPDAAEVISGISIGLVGKIQNAQENFREIQMRCNDSMGVEVVANFPQLRDELTTFQKLCNLFATDLQNNLAKKLPNIREGKEDERSAKQLFVAQDSSPFYYEKLCKWLDHKEREINVIRSCVETMKGTKIVLNQAEVDREVLAAGVEDVLCFVFTSMIKGDTYLDEMATYLDSPTMRSTKEEPWYFSNEVLIEMRNKAKAFHDLSEAQKNNSRVRFIITATANDKYKGATIYHYKKGIIVSEAFSKPDLPPTEITEKTDLIWHACDLTLDPNTANSYLYLSEGNKKATCGSWQYYSENPERFDTHTQVLCREGLSGRHYWEVEWNVRSEDELSKISIYAAVAYKRIERKGDRGDSSFGSNPISWAFGQYYEYGKNTFRAWQNGLVWETSFPSSGCKRIGVYLDWPAGTLSFYKVSSNTLSHLYTFYHKFTEPLYPGFWAYNTGNYAYLHPIE